MYIYLYMVVPFYCKKMLFSSGTLIKFTAFDYSESFYIFFLSDLNYDLKYQFVDFNIKYSFFIERCFNTYFCANAFILCVLTLKLIFLIF